MSVTLTDRHDVVVEELDRGVEEALSGLAPTLAGHPPVGRRHLLGVRTEGDDGGLAARDSVLACHASVVAWFPKTQVAVRIRCRDGADGGPPAHPARSRPGASA